MKNGIEAMITDMTATTAERRTTQARTGFYTAVVPYAQRSLGCRGKDLFRAVTATRQSATASGQPVKSSKPPKADRSTLKKWRT